MSVLSSRALLAGVLLWMPLSLPAAMERLPETAGAAPSLSLREALDRTLRDHPNLKAFAHELRAQEGRVAQAATAANPELTLEVEDVLGSGARKDAAAAQTTLSLRQLLERGALPLRREAAEAQRSLLETERAERQLDAVAETSRLFVEVLSDQRRLQLTHEAVELAARAVEAARLRVQAGKAPDAELARAEAALARMELDHEDVEHELLTRRRELAAQWGDAEPGFGEASGRLADLPAVQPYAELLERLAHNPGLLRYSSEARLREAELRLAEQRRKPAWTLSAGLRHFADDDGVAGMFGLSLPLTLRDRGEGAIATARAQREQVDARREAGALRQQTQLFALFQELQHARHVAQTLETQVLPRVQSALQQTLRAYERGRYGYLELVAAQREWVDVQHDQLLAARDAHLYAIEIDRLTGSVPVGED